jgi:DNA-binding Lrp family transcriptional regulator
MAEIDDRDLQILDELQRDGSLTNAKLAGKPVAVGLSAARQHAQEQPYRGGHAPTA